MRVKRTTLVFPNNTCYHIILFSKTSAMIPRIPISTKTRQKLTLAFDIDGCLIPVVSRDSKTCAILPESYRNHLQLELQEKIFGLGMDVHASKLYNTDVVVALFTNRKSPSIDIANQSKRQTESAQFYLNLIFDIIQTWCADSSTCTLDTRYLSERFFQPTHTHYNTNLFALTQVHRQPEALSNEPFCDFHQRYKDEGQSYAEAAGSRDKIDCVLSLAWPEDRSQKHTLVLFDDRFPAQKKPAVACDNSLSNMVDFFVRHPNFLPANLTVHTFALMPARDVHILERFAAKERMSVPPLVLFRRWLHDCYQRVVQSSSYSLLPRHPITSSAVEHPQAYFCNYQSIFSQHQQALRHHGSFLGSSLSQAAMTPSSENLHQLLRQAGRAYRFFLQSRQSHRKNQHPKKLEINTSQVSSEDVCRIPSVPQQAQHIADIDSESKGASGVNSDNPKHGHNYLPH